ncbi:MAG: carbohydrate ABC transporter permease [Clostridia bacterium]|nr:carbohydrate ABC transporter permease [Clostridia bacterium]
MTVLKKVEKLKSPKVGKKAISMVISVLRYAFFLSFSFVLLYPFLYMFVRSIMGFLDTYDITVVWIPKSVYLGNYANAIKVFDFWKSLTNTVVYELVAAFLEICSCAVAAYGLSRYKFVGKKFLSVLMVLNILVPSMMLITTSYVNFSNFDCFGILSLLSKITGKKLMLNLIDTPAVFYLPAVLGVGLKGGLFIFIYSQFFKSFPKELEEAASIDGAGHWKTFLRIVVPSSGSAIITVVLFALVWHWNDYYLAQMYIGNHPTLSMVLNNFSTNTVASKLGIDIALGQRLEVPIMLAGCLLYLLPLIVIYLFIQKRFINSITTSGIVG